MSTNTPLAAGVQAPEFTLHSTPDQTVSLSELAGQPVILAFYPADWSPVCGDQMALYNEILSEFHQHHATLVGISVDGAWCHAAFAHDRKLRFPLLSDFEPKGAVAKAYGVYQEKEGMSGRALFVLDAKGVIRWSYLSPVGIQPWRRWNPRRAGSIARRKRGHRMSKLKPPVGDRDHIEGPPEAQVTLVEYGDYECPHCGRAYSIVKEIQRVFGKQLRFVFRNFPLGEMHPHAEHAAEAAEIAGEMGKFWPMHDMLFEHQAALGDSSIGQYAGKLGLDVKDFLHKLAAHEAEPRVKEDFLSGVKSGVNGTPTFFIDGVRYDESWDLEYLTEAIQSKL